MESFLRWLGILVKASVCAVFCVTCGQSWGKFWELPISDAETGGKNISHFSIMGNATPHTAFFDSRQFQFKDAPNLTGDAGNGGVLIKIDAGPNRGNILIIHGNASAGTSIFNPESNSMVAGPTVVSGIPNAGAHSFKISSGPQTGKFLLIHGGNSNTTSVYDPSTLR